MARQGDAFVTLYAPHRMAAAGPRPVRFAIVDGAGRQTERANPEDVVTVVDAGYPVERIQLAPSAMSLLAPEKVSQEEALVSRAFSTWTAEKLWQGPFSAPATDQTITSGFGRRRSINGAPPTWAHEGTDFRAQAGDPVTSAANGRVVLAQPLEVRGNAVVVDHGWGVLSGYYHLSRIDVAIGQPVLAGEIIGLAGATGLATGPHLHFEVRVHNVNVEPLQWLDADTSLP
jgi:murein DD-endopeptidase MepM/ murein hydrolase activator NlpD